MAPMYSQDDAPVQAIHSRILTLFLFCSLAYSVLVCRFVYLQAMGRGVTFSQRDIREIRVPARRGNIYDRNGVPLAIAVDGFDIWVRPNLIRTYKAEARVVNALAPVLGAKPSDIQARVALEKPFAFVWRNASRQVGRAVLALQLPGVGADPVYLR